MNVEIAIAELKNLIDYQFNSFVHVLKTNNFSSTEISSRMSDFKCEINILKSQFILEAFENQGYKIGEIAEEDYDKIKIGLLIIPLKVDAHIQKNYNDKIVSILLS